LRFNSKYQNRLRQPIFFNTEKFSIIYLENSEGKVRKTKLYGNTGRKRVTAKTNTIDKAISGAQYPKGSCCAFAFL
jgi:hypothetical protein